MTKKYVVNGLDFPKRWRDKHGLINIMAGPVNGYVMVRRPRCIPFVLTVRELLNETPHPNLGPFDIVAQK